MTLNMPDLTRYVVTVSNAFDAESPEDAVVQMAAWLVDSSYQAAYRVDDGYETQLIDAESLRTCDDCGRATDAGAGPDWPDGVCERCDPNPEA